MGPTVHGAILIVVLSPQKFDQKNEEKNLIQCSVPSRYYLQTVTGGHLFLMLIPHDVFMHWPNTD